MKHFYLGMLLILLTSCKYFDVKKTSSEAILKEELQTFNWNEVDEYPTFSFCDSLSEKPDKKHCFQNYLTTKILNVLQSEKLVVTHDFSDTIDLKFKISDQGELQLLDFEVDTNTLREIPEIKSLIQSSVSEVPKIYPAIKRGQQVKTEFTLPLVVVVK